MKRQFASIVRALAVVPGLWYMSAIAETPAQAQGTAETQAAAVPTQSNLVKAAITGDGALSAGTIADLKQNAGIVLQTYPAGGALMISFVNRAVASDFSLLAKVLELVAQANDLQQSAIGSGLGQAAQTYENNGFVDNAQAIAEAVAANGNQRVADAFAEGFPGDETGAVAGAAPGAVGAPAAVGGPVGTSTGVAASNAVGEGGGGGGGLALTAGGETAGTPVSGAAATTTTTTTTTETTTITTTTSVSPTT